MKERAIRFLSRDTTLWGPFFLLCTIAVGPLDLLFLALAGFTLCALGKMRGCYYALALLGIAAAIKHAFFTSDHLFQLGVEASLGCAFFITALAWEQGAHLIDSLTSQIETRKAALENLEEEMAKVQEASQGHQITFQEKAASLQKELEDLQSEHSSMLILNEVLRKTTARHIQESEAKASEARDLEHQKRALKEELTTCQSHLARLSSDEIAIQNRELMKELNAARYEKEQTYLINETLARLYARENLKAKEANLEAGSLADQLAHAHSRVREITQEKLELPKEVYSQEKMMHLSQIEPLFKQLKKQFEEKNQILNQTRSDLFKSDTELQTLRLEKASLDLNPIPQEVETELQQLGEQVQVLEEENLHLQDLITHLTKDSSQKKN